MAVPAISLHACLQCTSTSTSLNDYGILIWTHTSCSHSGALLTPIAAAAACALNQLQPMPPPPHISSTIISTTAH